MPKAEKAPEDNTEIAFRKVWDRYRRILIEQHEARKIFQAGRESLAYELEQESVLIGKNIQEAVTTGEYVPLGKIRELANAKAADTA